MQQFHGPRDYLDAARSPDAAPEDLRALASCPYDFVHLAVAERPATPPALVPASLHTRDRYDGFAAGVTLSRRDDTPWPVLQELLDDPRVTTEFRKVVARETTREEVLEVLRGDPSERVRRAVAKRSSGG